MKVKPMRRWSWKDFWLLTMVLPGAIWLLLIRYLPMLGVVIAFKDYKAQKPNTFWNNLSKSKWVGLKNFEFLKSPSTVTMIRNTLVYNGVWIVLVLVLAVTLAVMMSELKNRFAAKAYQTMMFFPYFLSWVVASYFVLAFLDPTSGMIPSIQKSLGLKPTQFYMTTTWWPLILTICNLWKNLGYNMVLFLAALNSIPHEILESAEMDGAGPVKRFFAIKLHYLSPTIFFVGIMSLINSFKIFREVYLLTGDYPNKLYFLQHFMNNSFTRLDYSKLSAGAIVMCVVMVIIVGGLFFAESRFDKDVEE